MRAIRFPTKALYRLTYTTQGLKETNKTFDC